MRLDLSASNYALSATNITIGTRGILNGSASTITCSGNWDSTNGTFNQNTSSVLMNVGGYAKLASGQRFHNLTINGTGSRLFVATGDSMKVADNLTVNSGSSVSLQNNSFVMNQVVNSGAIIQNGKRLNITGSSTTPLTGYGTFDGDLYLNGSTASSYEIQTSLPMGNLHTDRDTKVSTSPTRYIQFSPVIGDFINATILNYGASAGYTEWAVDSSQAVTYTLVLAPNQLYEVSTEVGKVGSYQADSLGVLQFTYNGPFSSHSFIVQDIRSLPCKLWASFTYSIEDLKVEFIDTTYAQPTLRIWSFGDGWGSTNPYPTHTYENSGTYRVTMRAYDEYGHSSMVEMMITVSLGPTTPLEHTGTGWNIYLGNGTVIGISAAGLLISGALSLVSSWYIPDIPIITIRARRLYGVLAILAALYFALFVKGISFGG
jgi:PKD repeat protein